jgi:hypothetical protein
MTRLFLITLLLLSNGPAYAEWVEIGTGGGSDEQRVTAYVDRDTVRRKGNQVKLWELYDYTIIQTWAGKSFLSSREQTDYDCQADRSRTLALTIFSGKKGTGRAVHSDSDERKWAPVAPASLGQALWKVACSKK